MPSELPGASGVSGAGRWGASELEASGSACGLEPAGVAAPRTGSPKLPGT